MSKYLNQRAGVVLCLSGLLLLPGCGDREAAVVTKNTSTERSASTAPTPTPAPAPAEPTRAQDPQPAAQDALSARPVSEKDEYYNALAAAERSAAANAPHLVIAEPSVLDLGKIPINDKGTGIIKLVNTGDRPMRIVSSRTSCGCTAANVPAGKELEPGESVDIEISMSAGAQPTQLTKTVTFIVDGQPPLTATVKGQGIAFAMIEPATISPERDSSGRVTVRSMDGQAFRITSVEPRLAAFTDTVATEHELQLSWDAWREMGQPARLTVRVDHPEVSVLNAIIHSHVRPDPANRQLDSTNPLAAESGERRQPVLRDPIALIRQNQVAEALSRIEQGVDPNVTDTNGVPLLSVAARHGSPEIVMALIKAEANVNGVDKDGRTPLMWAGHSKNPEIVRLLLAAGADVNARDNSGSSALAWTAMVGNAASVRLLLDAGAKVDTVSSAGYNALLWASGYGEPDSVKLLVQAGADLETADPAWNMTPIMHAARTGRVDNVKVLLDAGAKLESRDASGRTVLLLAAGASGSNVDTIKALLAAGAKLDVKDARDRTALDHARARTDARAAEIVVLLESLMSNS